MISQKVIGICFLSGLLMWSCNPTKPWYAKPYKDWQAQIKEPAGKLKESVFLIGDAGEAQRDPLEPVLALLQRQIRQAGKKSTLIFLGDNIYPLGLPKKKDPERQEAELRLKTQLDILAGYAGRIVVIPGNHDWKQGKKGGLKAVRRQEHYVEKYLERGNVFLPDKGCPGPVEIKLSKEVVLIVLDTQWWLHRHRKPKGDACDADHEIAMLNQLKDALDRHKHKRILVAAHHPLFSNGHHGGNFQVADHLFPLRALNKDLFIPLPLIGSIYPLYRKLLGNIQDIPHPRYQALKKSLLALFESYPGLVYAAGHEHNLQYFKYEKQHYLVSGSGCKSTYVAKGNRSGFTSTNKGFMKVDYFKNGEVWLETWAPAVGDTTGQLIFKIRLEAATPQRPRPENIAWSDLDYADSTVTVVPGDIYEAGEFKRLLLGNQYREAWLTPVEVPMLDLKREKGGLTPIKKGGGQQTRSLRLKGGDGKQYVIRSVQKYPIKAIPKLLRKTFAADLVQDQISASFPFAAPLVPMMATAAGVFHARARMVFVPDDPGLGIYREEFGGMLAIFEERLTGDQSDLPNFGHTRKIVSTFEVLDKIHSDHHHSVDQQSLLNARLFDLFLNDWDRHDDQWRWASFESDDGIIYRPIPRDRDQVFFKFEGLLPSIANRKWGIRKFQHFDHRIRDVAGLSFNARYVDRSFLTALDRETWQQMAGQLKDKLTDEVIENAIRQLPDTIFRLNGPEIIAKLRSRRDQLPQIAMNYYRVLAREVDVIGSHKNDYFEVVRQNDSLTAVTVYGLSKKGKHKKKKIYSRVFHNDETREIRLYGLDGEDIFDIDGETRKGILVRVIGGRDKDKMLDSSHVRGLRHMTRFYDTRKHNKVKSGKELRLQTSKDPIVNDYDRKAFIYDVVAPVATVGYNPDNGFHIGGGVDIRKYGFRKTPYQYRQKLTTTVAAAAFKIHYLGDFRQVFGKWGFFGDLTVRSPRFVTNFYGLGNETPKDAARPSYHRIRLKQGEIRPALQYDDGDLQTFKAGLFYQYTKVDQTLDNFTSDTTADFIRADFDPKHYTGLHLGYAIRSVENPHNPTRGFKWQNEVNLNQNVLEIDRFLQLRSEFVLYLSFNLPFQVTLATRAGAATNIGDFEFYQANVIGGAQQIRGTNQNRFAGRSSFYHNTELRIKAFTLNTYIVPVDVGILGLYDQGRVWADQEVSTKWHQSYGFGIWLSPLDRLAIINTYSYNTDEQSLFTFLQFGFFF